MRATTAGLTHGEAPLEERVVLLRLRKSWRFDPRTDTMLCGTVRMALPKLPKGARFTLAVPELASPLRKLSRAERDLAAYVHLVLPRSAAPERWLHTAEGWSFCESAQLAPTISLP